MTDAPEEVTAHPLCGEEAWIELRDRGISPFFESVLSTNEQARLEFLTGAWLLGLLGSVQPQMLRVVDMLNAGRLMNAVIMPRRSSKTTTLFCILLGRCYLRPVHFAGFTLLTTQKKTAERYRLDIYGPIFRRWPDAATAGAFGKGAPVRLFAGSGTERVEFPNGSVLAVLSPEGDAIRSGAYDTLLADEGGEATLERWEDVIGAVIPAFDTRPEGQLILAGTAGDYRGGSEFWKTLNDPRAGVIRYTLPDDVDPEELEAWEPDDEHPKAHARELIESMHPGLYGLTTLERIENSFERLGVKKFTREYFGVFGSEGSNMPLLSQGKWLAAGKPLADSMRTPPRKFVLVADVHPDALWSCVGVAWYGPEGKTIRVGLLHWQAGREGFAKKLLELSRKFKKPITYDPGMRGAATAAEVVSLREARPAPTERIVIWNDVKRAAVTFSNALNEGRIEHFSQPELTSAVEIAVKRESSRGDGWTFGRPKNQENTDISPLVTVAMAAYLLPQERESSDEVDISWF